MIPIIMALVKEVSFGHQRCDGTFNGWIEYHDGREIQIYGLSPKAVEQVEYMAKHCETWHIDLRYATQTEEQWYAQNGINKRGA